MSSASSLIASGVPESFFAAPKRRTEWFTPRVAYRLRGARRRKPANPVEAAFSAGRTDGLLNRQHMPELNYATDAEWRAHLDGWREGQREREQRRAA